MAFTTYNIELYRGDTPEVYFWIKEPVSPGSTMLKAADVTGWSFNAAVNSSNAPADAVGEEYSVDETSGIDIVDATGGLILFNPGALAQSVSPGTYYWDIQYTDGNGIVKTFAGGTYTVIQDISKGT